MVGLAASTSVAGWVAWGNVVVLGLVGGVVTFVSLVPLAMANAIRAAGLWSARGSGS